MHDAQPHTVIEPSRGFRASWAEFVERRELLGFLVWRDLVVRYRQTVLGAAWAVLQPALTMVVFTVLFGRLANMPSQGVPYPVFSYAGLLLWFYFQNSVSKGGQSLVNNTRLLTKVHFPRIFLPLAATLAALVDYAIAIALLVVLMVYYDLAVDIEIAVLPLTVALAFAAATGAACLFGAANVRYRDVRYVLPFTLQLWMFATPVIWPLDQVPADWRWAAALNPMAGVLAAHRAAILPTVAVDWQAMAVSTAATAVLLAAGTAYFRRVESTFADVV